MTVRTLTKSFGGGELTPEFFGRVDDPKYMTGLAVCRNFTVRPHGPVSNRPGTVYVNTVKDSSAKTKLLPFVYSTTQTFVLEVGNGYIRFHTAGATLLAGSPSAYAGGTAYAIGDLVSASSVNYYCIQAGTGHTPVSSPTYWYPLPSVYYEIPTPYLTADLFDIHYTQSDDVLTLVHPNYPPMELRRLGATQWTLTTISFVSALSPPASPSATASPDAGSGLITMSYVVSTVDSTGIEESLPSAPFTCSNNLLTTGNLNTINFTAATGGVRYNVYKLSNGLYGFVGQTATTSFVDDNITADISKTPPIQNDPFENADNYPSATTYFQQRRDFAGTLNQPQNIWMTRSGTEANLSYSIPTHDDDSVNFKIAAREANTIRHLVPMTSLIVLTSAAEYRITSINSDAITPTSVSVTPQSYVGASNVVPIIVNYDLLFVAARGGHVREMAYAWQFSGYITGDLCLRAPHLFDGFDIVDMAYAKCPYPIAWATSTSGNLLGLTYVPEQQVGSWHRHDTYTANGQSLFESVCVTPEGGEDAVYVIVNRSIGGNTVRYIERFASQLTTDPNLMYFVDAGVSYSGAPITTINSGISHLEGETVSILADGAVVPQQIVRSGTITLDNAASNIQIGLPITADIQTLPMAIEMEAASQSRQKNLNQAWLRVTNSSGIMVGPSFDDLTQAQLRTTEPYGTPPALKTGIVPIVIEPSWGDDAQLCVRQTDPLPLIIDALILEVAIGA